MNAGKLQPLHARRALRASAGVLLWALLAGYLIVNRPFAGLGFPPLYIGEIVIFCCLCALLGRYRETVLVPLQISWPHRLIALFFLYTAVRVAIDLPQRGLLAARDGVIGGYALLAFLAPALWTELASKVAGDQSGKTGLPVLVARMTLPIALLAALWAAGIRFFYIDFSRVPSTKIDFLTIAAVIACWMAVMLALEAQPLRKFDRPARLLARIALFFAGGILAYYAARLTLELPTRSMYLTAGPLAALIVMAWAYDRPRQAVLGALAGVAIIAVLAVGLGRAKGLVTQADQKYALAENLNFSIDALEEHIRRNPDNFEKFRLSAAMTGVGDEAERERIRALFGGAEGDFTTEQGRQSAHSLEWRAIFWSRSVRYMLRNAPVFGIGFGVNLTNLLRNTKAWAMFIPSMSLDPPNRSPHSAHVTILTRLGVFGGLLWAAVLVSVFFAGLRACWRHRALASSIQLDEKQRHEHRRVFWCGVTTLGLWLIFVWAMTFNVVLENPFGGMWFWSLTGVLAYWGQRTPDAATVF